MARKSFAGKVRLAIDFPSPEALIQFVDALKRESAVLDDADAFMADALDEQLSGVTIGNTFVLKNTGERLPGTRLRDLIT